MDFVSIIGIFVAVGGILFGQALEGGHIESLLNLPAFFIVVVGTFGAMLLETPWEVLKRTSRLMWWIFIPPKLDFIKTIEKVVFCSNVARKEGILALEKIVEEEQDPFFEKALSLLIDGSDAKKIRNILENDLERLEEQELLCSKVFEGMGGYSPTIGIIGAVLGLIHIMGNLSDPSKLGPGIATAFVATVYGVGAANLLFLPFANKLHQVIMKKAKLYQMFIEGIIGISNGENPKMIEINLRGFIK